MRNECQMSTFMPDTKTVPKPDFISGMQIY